jgi:hypothetical protein
VVRKTPFLHAVFLLQTDLLPRQARDKYPKKLDNGALRRGMYVIGTFYAWGSASNSSDLAYNSAPFFDRSGTLMGVHNKNELCVTLPHRTVAYYTVL